MFVFKLDTCVFLFIFTLGITLGYATEQLLATHPELIKEIPNPISDSDFEYNRYASAYNMAEDESEKVAHWIHYLTYKKERAELERILDNLIFKVHELQTYTPVDSHLLSLLNYFKEDLEAKKNFADNTARLQTIEQISQLLWISKGININ